MVRDPGGGQQALRQQASRLLTSAGRSHDRNPAQLLAALSPTYLPSIPNSSMWAPPRRWGPRCSRHCFTLCKTVPGTETFNLLLDI